MHDMWAWSNGGCVQLQFVDGQVSLCGVPDHDHLQAALPVVFEQAGVRTFLFRDDGGALFVEGVRRLEHNRVRIAKEPR